MFHYSMMICSDSLAILILSTHFLLHNMNKKGVHKIMRISMPIYVSILSNISMLQLYLI